MHKTQNAKTQDTVVRAAAAQDLPALEALFVQARRRIGALGIDQWQDGRPNRDDLLRDIARGAGYVFVRGGCVQGYAALLLEREAAYDAICGGDWRGHWRDSIVVHRVAVSDEAAGTGLGAAILAYAAEFCRAHGRHFVRLDTHRGNTRMRGFLAHAGYDCRGQVTYAHLAGDPVRVCYEKRV